LQVRAPRREGENVDSKHEIEAFEAAALEGVAINSAYTLLERLTAALRVIRYLRTIVPLDADERHIIELRVDGWTIQHPLSCRPNLLDCLTAKAASHDDYLEDHVYGRFVCSLDEDGLLAIGEEVE
jgi:hypothetical protein